MSKFRQNAVVDWFRIDQAAEHAQLTKDMVNYLCRYGIAKPTGGTKRGRGCARRYTFSDIIILRVISKLLASGISVLKLRKSLVSLQKRGKTTTEILSKRYLATDGKNIYLQDNDVLELLTTRQLTFAFVLELETVREELTLKIAKGRKRA
ncbi:MAG: MerR family transcriptional regulator [Candidatus Scalindua sp.]